MDFSGFNWIEIIIASLSGFVIGYLWYAPWSFGKSWQGFVGLSDEDMQKMNPFMTYGLAFIMNGIIAMALSFFVEFFMMLGSSALLAGIGAVILGFFFVASTLGINYLFAQRKLKHYLIDAGYMLTLFFVMGMIIGAWH